MKCKNCGKEIDKSWKFCRYCGAEVQGETQTPRAGFSRMPGKWTLLLMAMLALVVGAFFICRMGQKESEQLNQEQPIQLSEQHYQENQEQSVQSNQEYPIQLSEQSIQFDNGDVVYRPEAEHLAYDAGAAVDYYDNLLFVYLLHDLDAGEKTALARKVDGVVVGNISGAINAIQIQVKPAKLNKLNSYCDRLIDSENVLYATYEFPILMEPNSYDDFNPWSADGTMSTDKNTGGTDGNDWWAEAIGAYKAWKYVDLHPADISDITVGIIDDGFALEHEELSGRISLLENYENNTPADHGTNVAGIIGAANNKTGIRGIVNNARMICVDYSPYSNDEDSVDYITYLGTTDWIEITKQLIEQNRRIVINNSWGFHLFNEDGLYRNLESEFPLYQHFKRLSLVNSHNQYDPNSSYLNAYNTFIEKKAARYSLQSAIMIWELMNNNYEDFLIVEGAGNGWNNSGPGYDASRCGTYCGISKDLLSSIPRQTQDKMSSVGFSINSIKDHVVIVAAVEKEKEYTRYLFAPYSNYGDSIDICAPGGRDKTSENGILTCKSGISDYEFSCGTSMAAPMVSGAAALVWSVNPELSAVEVKHILVSCLPDGAVSVGDDAGNTYPMLNVGMAVKKAAAMKTSGYCGGEGDGTNCTWNFDKDTGTLTISGTGLMADWSHKEDETAPWFSWCEEIKTLKIEDGVTNIGKYAFYDCSRMTKAEMADSVLTIGEAAFSACNDMTEIIMSANLSAIESRAFNSCFSLPHIDLPGSLKKIGNDAFVHCRSLDNIQLPLGIQTINTETFYACSSLSGMTLPNSIIDLSGTFAECTGLKWLSLPENFSKLGYMALYKCDGLTDIYFAGSEEQWKQVYISKDNNDTLKHVTIHFGITAAAPTPAPKDAEKWSPNTHYYEYFSNVADTWEEAERYCESIGGHLATITSPEENEYVFQLASEYGMDAYFGLSLNLLNGACTWVTGERVNYLNWAKGEPSGKFGAECYGMFSHFHEDGRWNDGNFEDNMLANRKPFICEWDTQDAYLNHYRTVFGTNEFDADQNAFLSTSNEAHNNAVNGSLIASAGDRLFFFNDMLWTGNGDLSEAKEIGIANGSSISTDGTDLYLYAGWIRKYDSTKVNQYGSYEQVPFDDSRGRNMMLEGGWVYYIDDYIDGDLDGGPIYRVRTDGSKKECVYSGTCGCFNIYGDKVYFTEYRDHCCIYRMDPDGNNIEKLSTQGGSSLVIEDEWLYYLSVPDGNIFKMRLDGSEITKIRSGSAGVLNVWKGYLYYSCKEDAERIHRIRTDGMDDRVVTNRRRCFDISICNDMIFYKAWDENYAGTSTIRVFHMYLDGKEFDIPLALKGEPERDESGKQASNIGFGAWEQKKIAAPSEAENAVYIPIMERALASAVKDDAHGLLYDVNGDGVDEILLVYKEDSQGYPILIEAYTIQNGEAVAVLEKDKLNQDIGAERGAFGVAEYAGNKVLCRYFTSGFNGPGTWTREKITLYDALTGEPAVRFEAGKFYELGTGSVTKTSYVFNGNSVSEQEYGEQYDQIALVKMIDREDAQYSLRSLLESAK